MTELSEVFKEKREYAEGQWAVIRESVRDAELYFHNMQAGRRTKSGHLNFCRNIALSSTSRLLDASPTVKGFPSKVSGISKVKVANAVYKHVQRDQEFDRKDFFTALRGLKQSASAQFLYWDKERGDDLVAPTRDQFDNYVLDEATGDPVMEVAGKYGSVAVREFGSTEFCFGPGGDIENALWAMVRMVMSEEELRGYLHESGASVDDVMASVGQDDMSDFLSLNGTSERKYVIFDFWHLPGEGRKGGGRGIYTQSGVVVKETDWPLPFRTLPFCVFQVSPIDGNPFGSSPFWDILPIQRQYDKNEKLKLEILDMQRIYAFAHSSIFGKLDASKHPRIPVPSIGAIQGGITYSSPPKFPEAVSARSRELVSDAYDTAGINEVIGGSERAGSNWSGDLVKYLNRMDSQKQKGAYLSWVSFLLRRARLVSKIYQAFAVAERVVAVVGENNEWEALHYKGTDLQDTDYHFEEMPGTEGLSSVNAAEAKDAMANGQLSLEAGAEMSETGLADTLEGHGNTRDVRAYIDEAMTSPGNVDPTPGMDPAEIIRQAEVKMRSPDGNVDALQEIINKARLAITQQAQQALEQNAQA